MGSSLQAINRSGDVLLAYEMNGRSLPPDHGVPAAFS